MTALSDIYTELVELRELVERMAKQVNELHKRDGVGYRHSKISAIDDETETGRGQASLTREEIERDTAALED